MEMAQSIVKVIQNGKAVEFAAEYSLLDCVEGLRGIAATDVLRYVRAGVTAEAHAEHARLVKGGRGGKDRPSDAEIQRLMSEWTPGQNYLAENRAAAKEQERAAKIEKAEARLAALKGGGDQ
jgi:hypothetical protein